MLTVPLIAPPAIVHQHLVVPTDVASQLINVMDVKDLRALLVSSSGVQ